MIRTRAFSAVRGSRGSGLSHRDGVQRHREGDAERSSTVGRRHRMAGAHRDIGTRLTGRARLRIPTMALDRLREAARVVDRPSPTRPLLAAVQR